MYSKYECAWEATTRSAFLFCVNDWLGGEGSPKMRSRWSIYVPARIPSQKHCQGRADVENTFATLLTSTMRLDPSVRWGIMG